MEVNNDSEGGDDNKKGEKVVVSERASLTPQKIFFKVFLLFWVIDKKRIFAYFET